MLTELTGTTIMRLTAEATFATYHQAPGFRGRMDAGSAVILSGEPFASLNYLIFESAPPEELLDRNASAADVLAARLEAYIAEAGDVPFLVLFAAEVGDDLGPAAERHGLSKLETMPLMVCDATGFELARNLDINVTRVADERDWLDFASPIAAAFDLTEDAVHRAMPASLINHPGVEMHLARHTDGSAVAGAVFTTHGEVTGIWTMGTHPEQQGQGYGRCLLTEAMSDHHRRGAASFFLDSTIAGERLYRRIGFRTIAEAEVWGKNAAEGRGR